MSGRAAHPCKSEISIDLGSRVFGRTRTGAIADTRNSYLILDDPAAGVHLELRTPQHVLLFPERQHHKLAFEQVYGCVTFGAGRGRGAATQHDAMKERGLRSS